MSQVSYTFTFPAPDRLISLNDRDHWAKRSRLTRSWRTSAKLYALADKMPKGLPFSRIEITLPVRDNRARDPHNVVPTCKAIVDGLVDAGMFADDNSKHLTLAEPVLAVGDRVTVTIVVDPKQAP